MFSHMKHKKTAEEIVICIDAYIKQQETRKAYFEHITATETGTTKANAWGLICQCESNLEVVNTIRDGVFDDRPVDLVLSCNRFANVWVNTCVICGVDIPFDDETCSDFMCNKQFNQEIER